MIEFSSGFARQVCTLPRGDSLIGACQRRVKAAFDPGNILNSDIFDADLAA